MPLACSAPSLYLQSQINSTLRITTTDARHFTGILKCTDRDRNLILSCTIESRAPSSSRYIGLVVIPGSVITKIELQEGPPIRRAWSFGACFTTKIPSADSAPIGLLL